MQTQIRLSASSIASFKACPTKYRLAYDLGIRLAEDTEAQRMGTNWHALHEVYAAAPESDQVENLKAVADFLHEAYATIPEHKTAAEWATEKETLWRSFLAYQWYWAEEDITPIGSEISFVLPLNNPITGLPVRESDVVRVGKIDAIAEWRGRLVNVERKSTAQDISPSADYWDRCQKDTQITMYALAVQDLLNNHPHLIPEAVVQHPAFNADTFGNTIYDVWRKPAIRPKKLTIADSKRFLEEGTYFEEAMEVRVGDDGTITVSGEVAETEESKSGQVVLRETPRMFGARLLHDLLEEPDRYFARREVARTQRDLRKARSELRNIYTSIKGMKSNECWFENEHQCRAIFACQYIPICYGTGADAVADQDTALPAGFVRLTVNETLLTTPATQE